MTRKCQGFGENNMPLRCPNPTGTINPKWFCDECEERRRQHLDRQFKAIKEALEGGE